MTKPKQAYPTDLNDTEWKIVMQYLPKEAKTGHPREHNWRAILNSIFYILRMGRTWRMMPHDLPHGRSPAIIFVCSTSIAYGRG